MAGVIFVACAGLAGLWQLNGAFEDYAGSTTLAAKYNQIDGRLRRIRLDAERVFSGRGSVAQEAAEQAAADGRAFIAELMAEESDAGRRDRLGSLSAQFDAYVDGFRRGAAERQKLDALLLDVDRASSGLGETMANLMARAGDGQDKAAIDAAQKASVKLQDAEVELGRFQLRPTTSSQGKIKKFANEAKKVIEKLTKSKEMVLAQAASEALQAIAAWRIAIDAVIDSVGILESLLSQTLAGLSRDIDVIVAEVFESRMTEDGVRRADVRTSALSIGAVILGTSACAILLGGLIAGLLVRGIVRPIRALTGAMGRLARADWQAEVPGLARGDELGDMARAVAVFKVNGQEREALTAEQARQERIRAERHAAMAAAVAAFEEAAQTMVGNLTCAATQLQGEARALSAGSEETTAQAEAVTRAAEAASGNVGTVAAAAEELAGSVQEIGRQMDEHTDVAERAVRDAEAAAATVHTLSEAAQRIGGIVALISNIAAQTNLLALNATIEAARAGEAGRGFAVVAGEVKNLASQTARATEDIATQINAVQASTATSAQAIGAITTVIGQMNAIAAGIAAAVQQQGVSTAEIARHAQHAAAGTGEVVATMAGVSGAAAQSSAASERVLASAGDLFRQSERLQGDVLNFLERVRAA